MTSARVVTIDAAGVQWARRLGVEARRAHPHYPPILLGKLCPFAEGTPHRVWWLDGYNRGEAT